MHETCLVVKSKAIRSYEVEWAKRTQRNSSSGRSGSEIPFSAVNMQAPTRNMEILFLFPEMDAPIYWRGDEARMGSAGRTLKWAEALQCSRARCSCWPCSCARRGRCPGEPPAGDRSTCGRTSFAVKNRVFSGLTNTLLTMVLRLLPPPPPPSPRWTPTRGRRGTGERSHAASTLSTLRPFPRPPTRPSPSPSTPPAGRTTAWRRNAVTSSSETRWRGRRIISTTTWRRVTTIPGKILPSGSCLPSHTTRWVRLSSLGCGKTATLWRVIYGYFMLRHWVSILYGFLHRKCYFWILYIKIHCICLPYHKTHYLHSL